MGDVQILLPSLAFLVFTLIQGGGDRELQFSGLGGQHPVLTAHSNRHRGGEQMRRIMTKVMVVLLILLVVAVSPLLACGKKKAVEEQPIIIGSLTDLSGVVPAQGREASAGELDAVRYINEVQGGIGGVQVELITKDIKYNSTLGTQAYADLQSTYGSRLRAVVSFITPGLLPNKDSFVADKVIGFGSADPLSELPFDQYWTFSSICFYNVAFDAATTYLIDHWSGSGKPVVGLVATTVNAAKVISGGIKSACDREGVTYLAKLGDPTALDRTVDLTTLKDAGANIVFLILSESGVIKALKDSRQMGLNATFAGLKSYATASFATAAGSDGEGMYCVIDTASWEETDVEGIQFLRDWNAEWHPEVTFRSPQYILSFVDVLTVAEAMRRAIDKVGYSKLDGDAIKEALEGMTDWNPMSLMAPLKFGPDRHSGGTAVRLCQLQSGQWKAATDWLTTRELSGQELTLSYYQGL